MANLFGSGSNFGKIGRVRATDHENSPVRQRKCGEEQKNVFTARTRLKSEKKIFTARILIGEGGAIRDTLE